MIVATVVLVAGCTTSESGQRGNDPAPTTTAASAPTTTEAVPRFDAATIAARQHYFGEANVDAVTGAVRDDRVLLSWFGNAGFAASFNGHVVLLDAYVNRFRFAMSYTGTSPEELAALAPEVLVMGHGHGDHVGDLQTVVRANPGITVVGTGEHCTDVEAQLPNAEFTCTAILPAPTAQAQRASSSDIIPDVEITAVRHPHNGEAISRFTDPADADLVPPSEGCESPPEDPADPPTWSTENSELISVFYLFEIGAFSLGWQNTVGANDVTGVTEVYRTLAPLDILVSPTVGLARGEIRSPIESLEPKVFVPDHHDMPCAGPNRPFIEGELAKIPANQRPDLHFLDNPADYLRPFGWDPTAEDWQ